MKHIRRLGLILAGAGILTFVGATAWWYMFYETYLGQNVKDASACFYQTTPVCEVGNIVGAFGDIPAYSPISLWVAIGLFVVGGLTYGLSGAAASD